MTKLLAFVQPALDMPIPEAAWQVPAAQTAPWMVAQWGAWGLVVMGLVWEVTRCRRELSDLLKSHRDQTEATRVASQKALADLQASHAAELRECRSECSAELRATRDALDRERQARLTEARDDARQNRELASQVSSVLDRVSRRAANP